MQLEILRIKFEECLNQSNDLLTIQALDELLHEANDFRMVLNEIKKHKDILIKDYIKDSKPPKILDINLLTYKALLFAFKDMFLNKTFKIKMDTILDKSNKEKTKLDKLKDITGNLIKIQVYEQHFPHLIGIRKPENDNYFIKNFLMDICYEYPIIDDFINTNADIQKLETFS